ncbi:MAG: diguanylate cyclase [bacterium]|nr:diguanylate cyclase [bacterium]
MKTQRINNRVLIADDERSVRLLLSQFLAKKGYEVLDASDGSQAVELVEQQSPNILLLDVSMPEMDGWEVCRDLRQESNYPLLYIILMTGHDSPEDQARAERVGANAFLPKPCDLTDLTNQIRLGFKELESRRAVMLDGLTHLYNRDQFFKTLKTCEKSILEDDDDPCGLLVFDLDHFKQVNETFGHEIGDQVLGDFAEMLGQATRKNDIPARLAGDRFAVLLPETGKEAAIMIASRIQKRCVEMELPEGIKLSVTTGGAFFESSITDMFDRAELALTQAKSQGRGLVQTL